MQAKARRARDTRWLYRQEDTTFRYNRYAVAERPMRFLRRLAARVWRNEAPEGRRLPVIAAVNGGVSFCAGLTEIGIARNESHTLRTATEELIDSLAQGNPRMSRPSNFREATLGGRPGLQTTLSNVSDATGRAETIQVVTALMRDGNLMYLIAVAPQEEFGNYQSAFQRVAGSVRLLK